MSGRVLVTGATGFIGGHIAEEAAQGGYYVRTMARKISHSDSADNPGLEVYRGDLLNAIHAERAVAGCSVIVHAAAKIGDWGGDSEYLRANLGMLKNLLSAASRSTEFRRFILISTLGVYEPGHHYGTTEAESMAVNALDGYTLSKIACEKYFGDWLKANPQIEGFVLRPGFVYGPRDRTVTPQLVTSLRQGRFAYFGAGDKKLNATYVKNLAHAVMLALKKTDVTAGIPHVFNVRDAISPTRIEFVETLTRAVGMKSPKMHVPEKLAGLLCQFCEFLARANGAKQPPLLSRAKFKFLAYNLDFSIDRIKSQLGYQPPYDLRAAMEETATWILSGSVSTRFITGASPKSGSNSSPRLRSTEDGRAVTESGLAS